MNVDKIFNLQYRKLLTKKQTINDFINSFLRSDDEIISLAPTELLSIFLIDVNNIENRVINDDEINSILPIIADVLNSNNTIKHYHKDFIRQIVELAKNIKLNDQLNTQLAINLANFLNKQENIIDTINIEVLTKVLS